MAISFLLFSAPVFLVIADTLLPSALLSSSLSLKTLSSHFNNYSVYGFCDGPRLSRGPYLGITAICSVSSLVFVSLKASFVFGSGVTQKGHVITSMETALFVCSMVMGVAHIIVAYRTSCRERRKLLVYKIDIEAISACKGGFSRYEKFLQDERVNFHLNLR
ncbi:hypothetical protein CXB51_035983 [Gossypium anomalum]|uniref:MENTAL domain-containing protein n=1 Tax=Gossypium anomalum TaxID=47600 RepID=A0A8J5XZG3_9ROSI|nr:hypothetical protein CXB51_035983 [Gossypium anomalum]